MQLRDIGNILFFDFGNGQIGCMFCNNLLSCILYVINFFILKFENILGGGLIGQQDGKVQVLDLGEGVFYLRGFYSRFVNNDSIGFFGNVSFFDVKRVLVFIRVFSFF